MAATALLTEGIVDKLLAYFEANLPAKIRALNAEYADDIKLKPPERGGYYAGEKALLDGSDYPRIFVVGEGWTPTRYNQNMTDADHRVLIIAGVKSDDTSVLQRQMYRYGRAIWELVVERFFASTGDDYFALHGSGDITVEFDRPQSEQTTQPYFGRTIFTAIFTKDERWA